MSTSIFAEWASRYGGYVITVDNWSPHLEVCAGCIEPWKDKVRLVLSDSVQFLKEYTGEIDLIYLDSLDYPLLPEGAEPNPEYLEAVDISQTHNLKEFKAVEDRLSDYCIVLLDDSQLERGGKPKLLKRYLLDKGWTLLFDFQQCLFVKKLRG